MHLEPCGKVTLGRASFEICKFNSDEALWCQSRCGAGVGVYYSCIFYDECQKKGPE